LKVGQRKAFSTCMEFEETTTSHCPRLLRRGVHHISSANDRGDKALITASFIALD
jgi:hypothetical protein